MIKLLNVGHQTYSPFVIFTIRNYFIFVDLVDVQSRCIMVKPVSAARNKMRGNKVGYRWVVSQNKITLFFKIVYVFRTASPLSRVQINTLDLGHQSIILRV